MTPIKKLRRPSSQGPALLAVDVGNSETTVGVLLAESSLIVGSPQALRARAKTT